MSTFETDLDAHLHVSPELVLVSPPDVARAAREALDDPPPVLVAPTLPPAPVPAERRSPSRALLSATAIVLVAGGFFAGRELSHQRTRGAPAAPAAETAMSPSASAAAETRASPTSSARRTSLAPPEISWKPRRGIRRYRFDLLTGRVAILTIITDEPRAQLPLSWPNAGRRRRLVPGRYAWMVRAAAGASRVIARGVVTIPKPARS